MIKQTIPLLCSLLLPGLGFAEPNQAPKDLPPHLQTYDSNGDGKLSKEERQVARKAKKALRKDFRRQFDIDGDGSLSPTEKKAFKDARAQKRLTRFDKDGDGKLNAEELARADQLDKAIKKRHKKHLKDAEQAAGE